MPHSSAKAGIVSWGAYVPRYRLTVEEISKVWGGDPAQIKKSLLITEKSVPDIDEDTATIAVEAARRALSASSCSAEDIGVVYIGSESHPYAVKPTGTIVGAALNLPPRYTTADFEFACKGGTAAMQAALAMVKAGMAKTGLAGGCDTAQSPPGDPLEYTAAAGGAVFLIGTENVVATINHTLSFTTDTPDFWRRAHERFPAHGGAFTGEPAYFRHVISATKAMLKEQGTAPADYTHAVFHQPNGKFPLRAGKKLGFSKTQLDTGLLVTKIGNTYSGASLLGLVSVLESAKPGDRILLTSYGSGAGSDSFDLTVTDAITNIQSKNPSLSSLIGKKRYLSYAEYLKKVKVVGR
ncbi:MAG: hydroxymethylglutaryl-CoA synthase [archaeon]